MLALFFALACKPHSIGIPDDSAPDTDVIDTDPDTDVSLQPVALGEVCDLEQNNCEIGAICCTECCEDGTEPVCTVPDEEGACPLPDLQISTSRLDGSVQIETRSFAPDACEIQEGCVNAPGIRRLLRFSTTTPNLGTAPLHFGQPDGNGEFFEYSECHQHFHFTGYANYLLTRANGEVAATGHKQAFCLMDLEPWSDDASGNGRYNCDFQGISVGWADTYDRSLDCQWIDITDVEPGDYTLQVHINPEERIPEKSFDNNSAQVAVHIPDPEELGPPTDDCANTEEGEWRDCGWTKDSTISCQPGADVSLGCDNGCDGQCDGDPMMRVCDGPDACYAADALATIDDSNGCGRCPNPQFTCPASGQVTVMTAPWRSSDDANDWSCDVTQY